MTNQPTRLQSQVKIKQHVGNKARRLSQVLKQKFGVSMQEMDAVIHGDLATAKKIGELARQAELYKEYAPKLADAYISIIQGTEAYAQAQADVLQAAGKSAIAIDKNDGNTRLAGDKYAHERRELALDYSTKKTAETERHKYQMNMNQIRGYIDAHLVAVDRQTALIEQSYRPEIKQIQADEQRERKILNEYLDNGNNARIDLIPEKQYRSQSIGERIKSALGF